MNDDDLRDFFAGLALISKAWIPDTVEEQARNCYEIADAMVAAKYVREPEVGIAAIKPKRRRTPNVPPTGDTERID